MTAMKLFAHLLGWSRIVCARPLLFIAVNLNGDPMPMSNFTNHKQIYSQTYTICHVFVMDTNGNVFIQFVVTCSLPEPNDIKFSRFMFSHFDIT